jgi:uncharacterized protein YbcC (UPF0753/DUF2309 family)
MVKTLEFQSTKNPDLNADVQEAALVVSQYWPMRTFVHHNPLDHLRQLPFGEAVARSMRFLRTQGYLPGRTYRRYLASGRITRGHLAAALRPRVRDEHAVLAGRMVTHGDVLEACMAAGLCEPRIEPLDACLPDGDEDQVEQLVARLAEGGIGHARTLAELADVDGSALGTTQTLSAWCDGLLGTRIVGEIDDQLVKWLGGFIDEGQAAYEMPDRDGGFYATWKALAAREWTTAGIADASHKIRSLPDDPGDALLEHLDALGIPPDGRRDYFALQMGPLQGWAAFLKWRSSTPTYAWQRANPIDLVQFLAVRLWYERELVREACRRDLGIAGTFAAAGAFMRDRVAEYGLRRLRTAGRLPGGMAREVDRLASRPGDRWGEVATVYDREVLPVELEASRRGTARRLLDLARAVGLDAGQLSDSRPEELARVCRWMDEFPETEHGPVWLEAFEASYQEPLLASLRTRVRQGTDSSAVRPDSQSVYCIDVRSEPFRRNLEAVGNHETFGFAGFFACFISYRAWGRHHDTEQYPVIVSAKNRVCEVPKSPSDPSVAANRRGADLLHAGHELLHDLKENVATPYVTVESLGWFYGLPIVGKTLMPLLYSRWLDRLRRSVVPPIETAVTVDPPADPAALEALTGEHDHDTGTIARIGYSLDEQVATVTLALKMMGLTGNFARLVLFCGHGSTTENNPFSAALDCGACGGNEGKGNARTLAGMANNPAVRARVREAGIAIPDDTWFLAGQMDTTTDRITIEDVEDVPASHRDDLTRLQADLDRATELNARQRCLTLPDVAELLSAGEIDGRRAETIVRRRSVDWGQVRPEWGLAGNAAFIIGRRALTKGLDLAGRTFLHSYDYREDPENNLLEVLLTAPQAVAQWINMEHYFSAADPLVSGAGSKIYHNVVGRIGVMMGPWSDLQAGLPTQTVLSGDMPYHEPLRLLTVIEAPRGRIDALIAKHQILRDFYDNRWVHLVAFDPEDGGWYRYAPGGGWTALAP